MNENKELKMRLLKEFGVTDELKSVDFCREAYKFLTEGNDDETIEQTHEMQGFSNDSVRISNKQGTSSLNPASSTPVAVDLGLPSGTLWADRNVGAKSPTGYGAYFSWGNIEGNFPNDEELTHDWGGNEGCFAMPFNEENYMNTNGAKLESDIDLDNDAARYHMGRPWKMPTKEQFKELYDNCVCKRKTIDGVNGLLFTSKINGNTLFCPAAGYGYSTSLNDRGSDGYYWSSSWGSSDYGYYMYFGSSSVDPQGSSGRYLGFSVRAVQ